jgi:hypothetical protein
LSQYTFAQSISLRCVSIPCHPCSSLPDDLPVFQNKNVEPISIVYFESQESNFTGEKEVDFMVDGII